MVDYKAIETRFQRMLDLGRRPVAVGFNEQAPQRLKKFSGSEPAGCSFWRLAAEGQSFSTVPSDHYNCPIGSYTHNIPMPEERSQDLPGVLGTMTSIGYLKMEEVPGISVLKETPKNIVYAPLGDTSGEPDVVLFALRPAKLMLLEEAALRAGVSSRLPLMARPTCMAIPAAMAHGMVSSAGCIGNRVYTRISDDELYAAIPGRSLEAVARELDTIASANEALAQHHQARQNQLSTA